MKKIVLMVSGCIAFAATAFAQEPDTSKINQDSLNRLDNRLPVYSVTASDVDNDMESQDVSSLLQSSRDVFTSMAGFNLSTGRFRIRGLGGENQLVMINGIGVNNLETGFASWSNWGGLNDVTRFMEIRIGVNACRYNFGGIGGYTNIETKASSFRKGTKFSYALSNRSYTHRFMVSQSTGLNEKGWAFTYALSARYAKEGYYDGTNFSAAGYYFSADKKVNDKHLFSFVGFGAPIVQGRSGFAIKEAYELTDNPYYNPNWGYQTLPDGSGTVKRNARVSNTHKPTAMLTHYYTPDANTKLTSTLFYSYGRYGLTSLNWYDAKNPQADYYRYFPSYYQYTNPSYAAELGRAWAEDVNHRQINWDALYNANYNNLYTLENANNEGTDVTGKRSKYIVEEMRSDSKDYGFNTVYNKRINRLFVSAGLSGNIHKGEYFKTLEDLLGGDFWVDVDQFAEQQFNDQSMAQNDLNNLNRIVKEGDKFGYNYTLNVNKFEAFGQAEYAISKVDVYIGANIGHSSLWRTGNYRNGRFPDNSEGDSEKSNFITFGVKGGVSYKVTGRHVFTINAMYAQRPPDSRSIYMSPRTNNNLVSKSLQNETVYGGDINYIVRYPRLKARLTGFYTEIKNQVWYRSFYHDEFRNFVNYALTGVDNLMMGGEVGVEATIITPLVFQAAFSTGQYIWNSRPTATITRDNSAQLLADNQVLYLQNYKMGNMPQTAGSAGFKYNGKKYWFAGFNVNFFADFYAEINPDRRSAEAVDKYVTDDPQWNQLLDQEKLPNNYTLDVYAGKSFRIKNKYYLNVNLNVNNVLNNQDFINYASEQYRYDASEPTKFASRYSYAMGINYFLIVSFRF